MNSNQVELYKKAGKTLATVAGKSVALSLAAVLTFVCVEPAVSSAVTDDVVVNLTVDAGISITSPADATMLPNLGVSANSSIATTTWNVKTNDPDGYTLTIMNASTSPAMKNAIPADGHFADYTEATPGTPETWAVDSNTYQFGYSAYGTDVNTGTYGSGVSCGSSGTPSGTLLYRHASTTGILAASSAATTTTSGTDTHVCFAAGQNGVYAGAGTYAAQIRATALVQ
jgi:hypothetical protein